MGVCSYGIGDKRNISLCQHTIFSSVICRYDKIRSATSARLTAFCFGGHQNCKWSMLQIFLPLLPDNDEFEINKA